MIGTVAAQTGPQQIELKQFAVPNPMPGTLVLEVLRANVCGSDIHNFDFKSPILREIVAGHEFVARIAALGEGVRVDSAGAPVHIGDRVVPVYFHTCRSCRACNRGDFNMCENWLQSWGLPAESSPHFHGAFATHYVLSADQYFYRVPDAVTDRMAAGANCGLSQMLFTLDRLALQAGETVVIQGAGGLGLYAAAVANERGARVIVAEGVPERIGLARRFGAHEVIDIGLHNSRESRMEKLMALTDSVGADVVLEVTGASVAFLEAVEFARVGGRIGSVGNLNVGPDHEVSMSPALITRKNLTVTGYLRYNPWYLQRALAFLERTANRFPFDDLNDRDFSLGEVQEAIEQAKKRTVARPSIVPAAYNEAPTTDTSKEN